MNSRTWMVITLAALSMTSANALQPKVKLNSLGKGKNVTVSTPFASSKQVFAGVMNVTLTDAPTAASSSFQAFCVDLENTVHVNDQYAVDLVPLPDAGLPPPSSPINMAYSGRAAWLYEQHGQSTFLNDSTAAGFQLAIWDILYDGGDGINAGVFQASGLSSSITSSTTGFLATSFGQSGNAVWMRALTHDPNNRNQDLMGPSSAAIPEPGAMALMAVGALPLLGNLRRSRKQ